MGRIPMAKKLDELEDCATHDVDCVYVVKGLTPISDYTRAKIHKLLEKRRETRKALKG